MHAVLEIVLSNLLVAGLLALLAAVVGLWDRRPAITHALWLLVMLKLVTPPLFECPIPWPESPLLQQQPSAQVKQQFVVNEAPVPVEENDGPAAPTPEALPQPAEREEQVDPLVVVPADVEQPIAAPAKVENAAVQILPPLADAGSVWEWSTVVLFAWLAGSCLWLTLALIRLHRFSRLLRFAQPAPTYVQDLARRLADDLQVRCPEVGVLPGNMSPMLWALDRTPKLLLPAGLLERLSEQQLATLLAHELAHWRRRDDRVRWLELVVLTLYWWCPLAWWARRELHQAEEECCDAWVVSLAPGSAKDYALALVETVEFLSATPASLPPLASGLGRVRLLKRRLTMILQGKTPRSLTFTGLAAVAGVGLLALPLIFSRSLDSQVAAQQDQKKPDRRKDDAGGKQPAEQGRDEIQRLQEQIQRQQQELQQMMQRLQQLQGGGGGQPGQKGQQGQQGGDKKKGGGPGFPGGPGGGGGRPGFGGPPGGFGGNPFDRINELERKLDMVLQELRALRNEMRPGGKGPGPKGPGAGGGDRPFDPNNPPRGKDGKQANPRPGGNPNPDGGRFDPNNRPTPPTPPAKPGKPRDDE